METSGQTSLDERACREIYQQYAKPLFHTCLRILNNRADAEDVLQETFVKAFRYMHDFKGESAMGTWLRRIAINESLTFLRRRRKNMFSIEESGHHQLPDDKEPLPLEWSDDHLQVEKIRKAIPLLPDSYRIVFSLYVLEGYDHVEIGEILGVTESTSKSQFHRAKAKLRQLLM